MASIADVEQQISVLEKEYDKLTHPTIGDQKGTYVVNGKKYSESELKKRTSDIQSDISSLKKVLKPVKDAEQKVKSAGATGPGQKLDVQGQKILDKAKANLEQLKNTNFTIPALKTIVGTSTQARQTGVTDGRTTSAKTPTVVPSTITKPTTAENVSQNKGGAVVPTGSSKPSNPKKGDTYTNSKNVKFEWDGKKWVRVASKKPSVTETTDTTTDTWKSIVQEEFGSLWDVYNDNPDVKKVIDQSVKEGWFNDETKLTAGLTNTNWYRTTQSSARQFAIRQSTDPATLQNEINSKADNIRQAALNQGTALSDEAVNRLASDSIKFGYTSTQLSNAIGSEVVATATSGGPASLAELSRGNIGTSLRQFADSYAIKPSDSLIEQWTANILSGKQSEENFKSMVQENARSLYKSLQPQIDKGMDVKTATAMYTNQATQILGIDESQIDWSDSKWNKALNYQDPKTNEYRAMDSSEWTRYLRSQPEWQNTDDAKNLYRSAAFTLAQAFGRTT